MKKIIRRAYVEDGASLFQDCHPLLQRLYATRNVTSPKELDRSTEQLLPFDSLLGIDTAATLLAEAVMQDLRILIVGDFDADGATSSAVAVRALKSMGANHVQFLVPNRFNNGYGLTPELVEAADDFSPELIVTVDNGIANHAGVDCAIAKNIKVIITDHHLPAATLPNAHAIVNPNQVGDPFPSKNLAGVGVIFYVMLALRRRLVELDWFQTKKIPEPNMARLLDIVALGTVADLVPLDHNNRILVHQGLKRIRAGHSVPGIVALLELADRDFTRAVASDLAFAVAARLNAAGRIDDMSLGIHCLLADDAITARNAARTLNDFNHERKSIEKEMQAQALQIIDKMNLNATGKLPRGLCLYDPAWHQGVIGILAARIKDRFHRPVIVFANGLGDEVKGSARSIPGLHVRDVLALIAAQHPHLMNKFGGHAMAAGLTLHQSHLAEFMLRFDEVVSQQLDEAALQQVVFTDGQLNEDELTLEVAGLLREAGPWGQAFPEPLFDDTFQILEQRIVGDKHLKLRLAKADKILDAMAFFVDTHVWPNHRCQNIHATYRLDVNEYKGRTSVQLIVDHLVEAEAVV